MNKYMPLWVILCMTFTHGCSSLPPVKSQHARNQVTSVRAYSSAAMHTHDFSRPVPHRKAVSNPAGNRRRHTVAVKEKPARGRKSKSPARPATFPEETVAGSTPQQEPSPTFRGINDWNLNTSYFRFLIEDTRDVLLAPLGWDQEDWLHAVAVAAITGGLAAADDAIKEFAQENRSAETDSAADVFRSFGDARFTVTSLATFYFLGEVLDKESWRRTALLSLESSLLTALFTQGLKFAVGRERPGTADSSGNLNPFNFSSAGSAGFPSGHTSHAFAIATVFATEYEKHKWVPPLAYGLAALTGLSRINDNKHWASDVFFGAALGYYTSKFLIKIYNQTGRKVFIAPQLDRQMAGVKVQWELP